MTFIGRVAEDVALELERDGYEVEILDNLRDRCPVYDAILVTNAVFDGKKCKLTVAPFKLEVES